mmetsp:Transcript_31517/g.93963  ORF Transcript_31517/g.93963 Transcript_31517/m.93963 type:complete len:92 (+) Transcript_31517:252-527(+)
MCRFGGTLLHAARPRRQARFPDSAAQRSLVYGPKALGMKQHKNINSCKPGSSKGSADASAAPHAEKQQSKNSMPMHTMSIDIVRVHLCAAD